MGEALNHTPDPYDNYTDEELDDVGMRRCACGYALYPDGDPDQKHCELDVR